MIDSHCHLADKKFTEDLPQVLERASANGISPLVTIADSIPEAQKCVELCDKFDDLYCTVGVHPHNAKEWNDTDRETLRSMAQSQKVKAIGEIGLDYHYDLFPRDIQKQVFRTQIELADELKLPLVIHNRESIADLREILEDMNPKKFVLHCCTEKWSDIQWIIERGCLLSFTGIATYKDAEDIRDTIRHCPLEQMMIETDAPYLAPVPHRGKRNEPAFVVEVAKLIADLKGSTLEEVDAQTTKNAVEFFGL